VDSNRDDGESWSYSFGPMALREKSSSGKLPDNEHYRKVSRLRRPYMSVFVALRGQVSGPVAGHRLSADATYAADKLCVLDRDSGRIVTKEGFNLATSLGRETDCAEPGLTSTARHALRTTPWLSTSSCQRRHADRKIYAFDRRSFPYTGATPKPGVYTGNCTLLKHHGLAADTR